MARVEKKTLLETHFQPRGWGWEYWIENIPDYCGKILHVNEGKRGSLHFHRNKLETMLVKDGRLRLRLIDTETGHEYYQDLEKGDSILIPRCQPHQIIALEECEIIEFSTLHEETDSYRLQKGD